MIYATFLILYLTGKQWFIKRRPSKRHSTQTGNRSLSQLGPYAMATMIGILHFLFSSRITEMSNSFQFKVDDQIWYIISTPNTRSLNQTVNLLSIKTSFPRLRKLSCTMAPFFCLRVLTWIFIEQMKVIQVSITKKYNIWL